MQIISTAFFDQIYQGYQQFWPRVYFSSTERMNGIFISLYVTLDHKTSLKSLGYICSNSQKYIVWVKMIFFSFMPKIIRILSKDIL